MCVHTSSAILAKRTFPATTLGSFPFLDDHCHHDMTRSLCKQISWVTQTEKLVQGGSLMTHFDIVIYFSGIGPNNISEGL